MVEPTLHGDDRGFFMETWNQSRYAELGIGVGFVQDNLSRSGGWTLRGLHYQIEGAQGKLVRVDRGAVFDVAVDLRRWSPTFGRWTGMTLSEENRRQMYVPPGFAHGFLTLGDGADFAYKCTTPYAPEHERVLRWNDPAVGIDWPFVGEGEPLLSERDRDAPGLADLDCYESPEALES